MNPKEKEQTTVECIIRLAQDKDQWRFHIYLFVCD